MKINILFQNILLDYQNSKLKSGNYGLNSELFQQMKELTVHKQLIVSVNVHPRFIVRTVESLIVYSSSKLLFSILFDFLSSFHIISKS